VRYYKIVITDPSSGKVYQPPGFAGLLSDASYTSFVSVPGLTGIGSTLPGAWDIELDIPVIDAATPQGFPTLRVWGISIQEINQATDLVGKNIAIFGGMQKGLPLAKPQQSGQLVAGTIFQAFGNWIGTDMTLDIVVMPGTSTGSQVGGVGTLAVPKNIVLTWPAGQTLATALKNCLSTAFPSATVNISISDKLVRPGDEGHAVPTLQQLAQFCRQTSFDIIKDAGYAGVSILPAGNNNTIYVFDGTGTKGNATAIAFEDMIGQPTWLEAGMISVKTVMRADLQVQQQVTLPQALITNTQIANSSLINQKLTFQGGFFVQTLRHVGRYRQPSADAWVTVAELSPNNLVGASSPFGSGGSANAVF
jgi:hypothetical protein